MRGAARRTTVDELRKQGRRTVSVLNFRDVQDLIEQAVENTLKRRGLKLDGRGIHEEVRLEFLALMRERDMLRKTVEDLLHERERLAENRERLDRALTATTSEYRSAQKSEVVEEADELAALAAEVEAALRDTLADTPAETTEEAVELVNEAFARQRAVTLERAQTAHEANLHRLERRMSRLKSKLSETEEMLARAQSEPELAAIPGQPVAAGLDSADPAFETKTELLSEIFKLNVELREMLEKN
ncbi:MAG: hypothetical protein DRQ55_14265 [Planctomycetota bacterium]|nr:MAG: hypothetical protein DRQ55_14265 [Planctomycetota bacterium]